MDTKICTHCRENLPIDKFHKRTVGGKEYLTTRCGRCKSKVATERGWSRFASQEVKDRSRAKQKKLRADGLDTEKFILYDSRQSDKRKGRPNDLTKEFIAEAIAPGCSYCGETELRMTLDRIDNDGGHTKDNVVPACYRCNHTRGNMPYEAWLYLTDGMRRARLSGSFGSWAEQAFSRRR